MHNAHVIRMKQHAEMRPMNMLKLLALGLAVQLTFPKHQRTAILRKLNHHIISSWN